MKKDTRRDRRKNGNQVEYQGTKLRSQGIQSEGGGR